MTKTQALARLYKALTGEDPEFEDNTQAEIILALAKYYEEQNENQNG